MAALLIAVLAVAIAAGGGWKKWSSENVRDFFFTRLLSTSPMSRPLHCSLLGNTAKRLDFVLAAERVVLLDGVYPAASAH